MRINIELNSKELMQLSSGTKEEIPYEFTIDLYTEAAEITTKEETIVLAALCWSLLTMLPTSIINSLFTEWNSLVTEIQKGLQNNKTIQLRKD